MNDDYQLIQRVVQGDLDCFRTLVKRYEKPLFCLIGNLVHDVHQCEDLAQETFLAAYRNLASYDPRRAAFCTWLLTIARNQCCNWLRKRRPAVLEALPEDTLFRRADIPGAEAVQQLDILLAQLPFRQRVALVLFEIQGLTYEAVFAHGRAGGHAGACDVDSLGHRAVPVVHGECLPVRRHRCLSVGRTDRGSVHSPRIQPGHRLCIVHPGGCHLSAWLRLDCAGGRIRGILHSRSQHDSECTAGDRVLVNKLAARTRISRRGEVIVFRAPGNRAQRFVKRVIGLPGETVAMQGGDVYVNGQKLPRKKTAFASVSPAEGLEGEQVLFEESNHGRHYLVLTHGSMADAEYPATKVPQDHVFVLGDNRSNSHDSRQFGSVPIGDIVGPVQYVYWPAGSWRRFGCFHHCRSAEDHGG